jgi:hypothetical protein
MAGPAARSSRRGRVGRFVLTGLPERSGAPAHSGNVALTCTLSGDRWAIRFGAPVEWSGTVSRLCG